jgi:hypothetical protein
MQTGLVFRINGFIDFVYSNEFLITSKHDVSESGSVSGEGRETRALLGPLERANFQPSY